MRGREDVMRGSGAGGLAGRAMGSATHMGMQGHQGMENDDRRFYFLSGHTRPPKFPTDLAKVPAWRHRMMPFLNSHGLGYTVKQSTNSANIISEDETILARRHTPQVVADYYERAWTSLLGSDSRCPIRRNNVCSTNIGAGVAYHSGLRLAN